jgi:hypothetical protein
MNWRAKLQEIAEAVPDLGPKALRFSEQGLQKYIATRAGSSPVASFSG